MLLRQVQAPAINLVGYPVNVLDNQAGSMERDVNVAFHSPLGHCAYAYFRRNVFCSIMGAECSECIQESVKVPESHVEYRELTCDSTTETRRRVPRKRARIASGSELCVLEKPTCESAVRGWIIHRDMHWPRTSWILVFR